MANQLPLYDRLNAELRLRQRDRYTGKDLTGMTQGDCDMNYWSVSRHKDIPTDKKADILKEVIREAFNHGYDVREYMEHFEKFCEDNRL